MELRTLGTTEIKISPVIMGTWQAGKEMWAGIDDKETSRALRTAYDAGITTFDTAEVYGNGHSERILGAALKDIRDKVILATKVFSNHLKSEQIVAACNRSLKNLNTDYIDLYQVHWPPGSFGHPEVEYQEIMGTLSDLKDQGKIRALGVSNFARVQMEAAAEFGRVESLQPPYSLFWRVMEFNERPYCIQNQMTILAYSPMAQGILTGKFKSGHQFEKGDHRVKNILFQESHFQRITAALSRLKPIAESHNATLAQLALAWVLAQPNTCAIAGARNETQVLENAKAADIRLSESDLAEMNAAGESVTDHLDDNPVMWKW
ncbi:MAG: aldo/keto reductase [Desulfobacteraceae bacterium]|nr:aldo/keto reductase [Desulfobacteraceae bacterium]